MVTINYAFREISCKIVYYGPGLSGKTTNLQHVHNRVPAKSRGDLISLATETDRTLYFDFLPIHVGDIAGFSTKFQLYTVPGQVFYNATRKLVLRGVDGIVFVADSQKAKMDENIESLSNMYENLRENGIDTSEIPIVIQYNKQDLPEIATIEELEETLNPDGRPYTEASAVSGKGVFDTLKRITKMVLEQTKKRTAVGPVSDAPGDAKTSESIAAASGGVPSGMSAGTPREAMMPPVAAASAANASAPITQDWSSQPDTDVAVAAAPGSSGPRAVTGPTPITAESHAVGRTTVHAAQRSLRIRKRRQRSIWSRLFGWLFGR